jgi:hypothetical protein
MNTNDTITEEIEFDSTKRTKNPGSTYPNSISTNITEQRKITKMQQQPPIHSFFPFAKPTYKDIISNWDLLIKYPNDTLLHALANISDVRINPDHIQKEARRQVINTSFAVIKHLTFSSAYITQEHIGILSAMAGKRDAKPSELQGIKMEKQITECIHTIRTLPKPPHTIPKSLIQNLSKITGAFLPKNSIVPKARKPLFSQILKKFTKKTGTDTPPDKNACTILQQFFEATIPPTEIDNSPMSPILPYFLNKQIAVKKRRELFFSNNTNDIYNWDTLPGSNTQQWCASGPRCTNDLFPAPHTLQCTSCAHYVHRECCSIYDNSLPKCFYCSQPPKQIWNFFSGGLITLDEEVTNSLDVTNTSLKNDITDTNSGDITTDTHNDKSTSVIHTPNLSPISTNTDDGTATNAPLNTPLTSNIIAPDLASNPTNGTIPDDGSINLSPTTTHMSTATITENPDTILSPNEVNLNEREPTNASVRFNDNVQISMIDGTTSTTRMQLRIPLIIQGYPEQWSLTKKLQSVLNHLRAIDHSIQILPWKQRTEENQSPINIDNINSISLDTLSIYFNRLTRPVTDKDKFVWTDFVMEHTSSWQTIKDGIASWLNRKGYNLYPRELQSEKEIIIGWFLWSYREIDTAILTQALKNDYKIDFYFRWMNVNLTRLSATNDTVKALHLITTPQNRKSVVKVFSDLYSKAGQKSFPLGIRLRLIPMAQTATSATKINEIKECRHDQRVWLKNIQHYTYNGILNLDKSSAQMPTLRELIMRLKSNVDNERLFFGVNQQWNNPEKYIFTFHKLYSYEAIAKIPTLITLLPNTTSYKLCYKYFTTEAIEEAKDNIWDEKNKEVIRPGDLSVPTDAIAADIVRLGLKDLIKKDDALPEEDLHALQVFLGNEESSVATFTSGNSTQQAKVTSKFLDTNSNSSASSVNTTSSITPMAQSDVQTILKSIASLSKTVTVLDANVKSQAMNSEELIGKMITLEQQISFKNNSNPSLLPGTGTLTGPGDQL